MSKFKVGDRVQFREKFLSYPEGHISTVVSFDWAGDPEITKPDGSIDNFFERDLADMVVILRDPDPTTLTRRDRFAMSALTEMIAYCRRADGTFDVGVVAGRCYQLADAMELARNKEGGE